MQNLHYSHQQVNQEANSEAINYQALQEAREKEISLRQTAGWGAGLHRLGWLCALEGRDAVLEKGS